jgi:hypothetical protein
MRGSSTSDAGRRQLLVISASPARRFSSLNNAMRSARQITRGRGQVVGSTPRAPSPRVTISRTYAPGSPNAANVCSAIARSAGTPPGSARCSARAP